MKVVVSGAGGLIGNALVAHLSAADHHVVRLVRAEPSAANQVRWYPESGSLDAAVLADAAAVVNLNGVSIGERRWTAKQKRRLLESRIGPTGVLAEAIAGMEASKPVLVSQSAVGYYGDCGDEILTEDLPPADDFLAGVCARWEAAARPAAEAGARVVTMRTGVVLSADGGLLPRMALPFRLGLGGRMGSGRQWMSWIALGDLVAAIHHVIANEGIAGPTNVVSPEPVTNAAFTAALAAALHRKAFLPTPMPMLRLVFGHELVESLMLGSQRAIPQRLAESGFAFRHPQIDGALRSVLTGA